MGRFTKLLKEGNNKTNLATHPLFNADESKKKDYFQSLVFVCVEDENFSDEEKEYLKVSLTAMGLDESLFDEFEKFTQNSDEDELLELVKRLKEFSEDEKLSFMVDVCVVAFKDGDFDESEMELFEEYLEMLEMKEHRQTILYLAQILNEKDIDGAISFYTGQKEIFEKFRYMFELLKIDVAKEMKSAYVYEWKNLSENLFINNKVALHPVTIRQFSIFLNSMLIENKLFNVPDTDRFKTDDEIIIQELSDLNLEYDKNNLLFYYDKEDKHSPIIEISWLAQNLYIEWINTHSNSNIERFELIIADDYKESTIYFDGVRIRMSLTEEVLSHFDIDGFRLMDMKETKDK